MKYVIKLHCSGGCAGQQFEAAGSETSAGFSVEADTVHQLSQATLTVALVNHQNSQFLTSKPLSLSNVFGILPTTRPEPTVSGSLLPPKNIQLESRSETSLVLVWDRPESMQSPLVYQVKHL